MSEKSPSSEKKSRQSQWEAEIILELTLLPVFLIGDFLEQLFGL